MSVYSYTLYILYYIIYNIIKCALVRNGVIYTFTLNQNILSCNDLLLYKIRYFSFMFKNFIQPRHIIYHTYIKTISKSFLLIFNCVQSLYAFNKYNILVISHHSLSLFFFHISENYQIEQNIFPQGNPFDDKNTPYLIKISINYTRLHKGFFLY